MAADSSLPKVPVDEPRFAWPRSAQAAAALLITISLLSLAGFAWRPGRPASLSTAPALLDLNSATRADLVLLPGVGEQMAQRIESYREEKGPFKSLDELRKVPGVGPVTLDRLRPWLRI